MQSTTRYCGFAAPGTFSHECGKPATHFAVTQGPRIACCAAHREPGYEWLPLVELAPYIDPDTGEDVQTEAMAEAAIKDLEARYRAGEFGKPIKFHPAEDLTPEGIQLVIPGAERRQLPTTKQTELF